MSRCRCPAVVAACWLALVSNGAHAEEAPSQEKPPSVGQAAAAVIAAERARDREAMRALAARQEPDPWLVADEVVARGPHAAAVAFARAAPRKDVERLPEYLESRTGRSDGSNLRAGLRRAEAALEEGRLDDAMQALGAAEESAPADVVSIRRSFVRGHVLDRLGRSEEGAAALALARKGAERIGWFAQASSAVHDIGGIAYHRGDMAGAASAWHERLALDEMRGDRVSQVRALWSIALALGDLGKHEEAKAAYERALRVQRADRDRAGELSTLGFLGSLHLIRHENREAASCYEQALAIARDLGDLDGEGSMLGNLGIAYEGLSRLEEALDFHRRSLALKERTNDRAGVGRTVGNMGNVFRRLGRFQEAIRHHERGRDILREVGDPVGAARNESALGAAYTAIAEYPLARSALESALRTFEEARLLPDVAQALVNLGAVHYNVGNYREALAHFERSREISESLGNRTNAAYALGNLASVRLSLGDHSLALASFEEVRKRFEAVADRAGAARALVNIGIAHMQLGNYPAALDHLERALAEFEAVGERAAAPSVRMRLGAVHNSVGDHAEAVLQHQKALQELREFGNRTDIATALSSLGDAHAALGNFAAALDCYREAIALFRELGDEGMAALVTGGMARVHEGLGNDARALRLHERALAVHRALGARLAVAGSLIELAEVQVRLGDLAEALAGYTEALAIARTLKAPKTVVGALQGLSGLHWAGGAPREAIGSAREAVEVLSTLVGGLAEGEGASVRRRAATVFDIGAQAAASLGDAEAVAFFLESGRAGTLVEMLGGRERLQARVLPEHLRREEAEARAKETAALERHRRSMESGDAVLARTARVDWEAARNGLHTVIRRIQRDAKAAAGVVYPTPDDLPALRRSLRGDEALVEVALPAEGDALALVVTAAGARVVTLGASQKIEEACDGALRAETPFRTDPARWAALRARVVAPLALDTATKRVLFSPDGALSYVPPVLLFDGLEVVAVPSGTTYRVLRQDAGARGSSVLALGDPDYGMAPGAHALLALRDGVALARLPATREEANAVGDRVLLGRNASEAGLRDALAERPRWRAVHLACHALVDPERPARSSLALTPDAGDDGLLTTLEVFQIRIPADLAVLSACETGRGRLERGEGVVGLMRAFMYAGAPRVLVSVWKVDDEPTRVLMERFYSLWNPKDGSRGLPAAAALRQAQAFVASHEKWRNPFFWAPWVLWGVGD